MRKTIILLIVAICLFSPVYLFGQTSSDDFTVVDEYYLGRAVAANILTRYRPFTQNAEATQYLNRICQALVINSTHPATLRGYTVMILDSQEINAFASPGGHIFITRGFLQLATSEDMLAAIIAHELAHVMLRHGITAINEARLISEMTGAAGRAAGMARTTSTTAARMADFRSSITTSIETLTANGYSQAQEYEADIEAMILLTSAGYDPRALLEVLKALESRQRPQASGFFSTHPSPGMRLANLSALNLPIVNTSQHRAARFRSVRF